MCMISSVWTLTSDMEVGVGAVSVSRRQRLPRRARRARAPADTATASGTRRYRSNRSATRAVRKSLGDAIRSANEQQREIARRPGATLRLRERSWCLDR